MKQQHIFATNHSQSGFTLTELLVGIAVSLLLLAGVMQIYSGNKQTSLFQTAQSQVQENGRYAMLFIDREIKVAGFRNDPNESKSEAYPALAATLNCPAFLAEQVVAESDSDGDGNPDILCIRTQSATPNSDCVGTNYVANGTNVVTSFNIDANGNLQCQTSFSGLGAQTLVSGLDPANDFTLQYGVDADNDKAADRYIDYATATASGELTSIVSIQITFQSQSTENVVNGNPLNYNFSRTMTIRNLSE